MSDIDDPAEQPSPFVAPQQDFDADDESQSSSGEEVIRPGPPLREESSSSSDEEEQNEQFNTFQDLLAKLNDDDHSEDQGIQDYKVGGYHPCHVGQVLTNRYVLIQKLGWGHFSTVWLAKDFKYSSYVAVKIMKSSPHYLEASYDQVQILQKVAKKAMDPEWLAALREYEPGKTKFDRDDCHVLNLLNAFLYKGPYGNHFCMVFEILGINLWEILKKYDCKGLPVDVVKEITRQVLMGLDFLNRICRVIHTDLKPQNVLVCLTEQELKKIVEDEQLANSTDFIERLNYYCTRYNMGPPKEIPQVLPLPIDSSSSEQKDCQKEEPFESETLSTLESRISEIIEKLQTSDSHNYKRTLKKKLKKLQIDREQQLQNLYKKRQQIKDKKQSGPPIEKKEIQLISDPNLHHKTIKQLFLNHKHKMSFDNVSGGLTKNCKVKIADLGNACWEHHHFATEIQTRQYRSPEVLLGSKYNLSADMWSLACMTFQLLTGQLLFNPKRDANDKYGKNDDHLAQIMELLGRMPSKLSLRGVKAAKYMSKTGALRRIPKLQNWSLHDVMIAKYRFSDEQAHFFEDFMQPMLNCYPQRRTLAQNLLKHHWLTTPCPKDYLLDQETHQQIKAERYDLTQEKDELYQYESEREDGDEEDNESASEEQLFTVEKEGDIRLIDRSFTDLGYIGYGTGIFLEQLDFGPNWQFA